MGKSRRSISALMDIRPDYANVEWDGQLIKVDPDEVAVGSVIVVQPGEKVPIDGVVIVGPVQPEYQRADRRKPAARCACGGRGHQRLHQHDGRAASSAPPSEFGESTVAKILELVENSTSRKSRSEHFISRFARVYTPAVCYCALALAVLPPVVRLILGMGAQWSELDLPRADLPGCQLPLRAGHQHPAQLLRRHRRRQQGGRAGQGLQLSGGAVPHQDGCV